MAPPTTKKTQRKAVADPKKDETPARASLSDTSTAPYEEGEYRVKEYLDVKMMKYKGRPEEPHFFCLWMEDPTPSWTPCRHASPKNPENRAGVLLMLRKLFKANPSLDLDPAIIQYFQSKNLDWRMARSFGRQGITDLKQKKPVVKKPLVEDKDSDAANTRLDTHIKIVQREERERKLKINEMYRTPRVSVHTAMNPAVLMTPKVHARQARGRQLFSGEAQKNENDDAE